MFRKTRVINYHELVVWQLKKPMVAVRIITLSAGGHGQYWFPRSCWLHEGQENGIPRDWPRHSGKISRTGEAVGAARGTAYLRAPVSFSAAELELFFDVEVDPMRDVCYLHGFVERRRGDNGSEQFVSFFSGEPTPEAEEDAFAGA
jgi:hypothetical protein